MRLRLHPHRFVGHRMVACASRSRQIAPASAPPSRPLAIAPSRWATTKPARRFAPHVRVHALANSAAHSHAHPPIGASLPPPPCSRQSWCGLAAACPSRGEGERPLFPAAASRIRSPSLSPPCRVHTAKGHKRASTRSDEARPETGWPSRLLLRARRATRPRDRSDERGGDGRARGRPRPWRG